MKVDLDSWHTISLAFNGKKAALSLDGKPRGTIDYEVEADDIAGQNYRIGYTATKKKS